MKRTFVEFGGVTRVLAMHGVSDDAILAMQRSILQGEGDLVKGTGGLRKIRCAAQGRGKSGGVRVLFADYPDAGICLLVAAFAKNVKENLTPAQRNNLASLKAKLDAQMQQRFNKTRKQS
ncbi:MAG: type II toxin-antitoxin system RelE/ParE family toxin [Phycisphaerae bacterium]